MPLTQHIAEIEKIVDRHLIKLPKTDSFFEWNALPITLKAELKSFLRHSLTAIVLKTLEEVEGRMARFSGTSQEDRAGYRECLSDTLATLSSIKSELTKEK